MLVFSHISSSLRAFVHRELFFASTDWCGVGWGIMDYGEYECLFLFFYLVRSSFFTR